MLASNYGKNNMGIHVREFKRYEDSYYPSKNGVTLQPEQFTVCFKHGAPTSIFDIVDINRALEDINPTGIREFYLLMTDDGKYTLTKETTARSGRVYKCSLDISFTQWNAIKKVQDDVITSYIALKFRSRDLLETFKMVSKRSLSLNKPVNNERYEDAQNQMNQLLAYVLHKNIGEKKGIKPPMRIGDEDIEIGELVSVKDFNESCMFLNVVGVVRDFEKALNENMLYPEREKLINFLSEQYLKLVHLDECIDAARKEFCSYQL